MNLKLKHYIATHTFHSSDALKGFKSAFKHRKKNSDWFNNETVDAKNNFFVPLVIERLLMKIVGMNLIPLITLFFTSCSKVKATFFSFIGTLLMNSQ